MSRRLVLLFAITCVALSAAGETLRLSLPDAIARALSEGTQTELARSTGARAGIAQREALGALLPQVEARLERYNQSINLATFGFSLPGQPPVVGPFNVTDAQITAAVQLFNLAALRRYEALRAEREATRYDLQQTENDVAAAVARLYVLVQRADAQIAARQADVTLFERLLGVAQDEFKAGTGTRLDTAQAGVQLARSRQTLLVAQNDREAARLALLNAVGADESSDLVLVDTLTPPTVTPPLDPALARASATRPELRQAATRVREAELMVAAARSRRLPSLAFDFAGDLSGNHTDDLHSTRRIAAVATVPLYRADIEANIARAKLQLHDAETALSQRKRDVEQDVRRSILTLQNAEARVAVATETVRVAEEALTVARDRRAAGYGSPIEVDRAQDVYRQSHEDLVAATADAVAAQYDFQHATGDIRVAIPAVTPSDTPTGTLPQQSPLLPPAQPITSSVPPMPAQMPAQMQPPAPVPPPPAPAPVVIPPPAPQPPPPAPAPPPPAPPGAPR
jgi:outer membrane protein TolC